MWWAFGKPNVLKRRETGIGEAFRQLCRCVGVMAPAPTDQRSTPMWAADREDKAAIWLQPSAEPAHRRLQVIQMFNRVGAEHNIIIPRCHVIGPDETFDLGRRLAKPLQVIGRDRQHFLRRIEKIELLDLDTTSHKGCSQGACACANIQDAQSGWSQGGWHGCEARRDQFSVCGGIAKALQCILPFCAGRVIKARQIAGLFHRLIWHLMRSRFLAPGNEGIYRQFA